MRSLTKVVTVILVILVFLAWSGGPGQAGDFANTAGEVTGDTASAVVAFFKSLAANKPTTADQQLGNVTSSDTPSDAQQLGTDTTSTDTTAGDSTSGSTATTLDTLPLGS